ncbi:hypothetical protein CLAFUW4_09751 [Fulvia fulva]|uniref:Uncharacterized protein n=1 Tax=Passalora fulva TaxID=5499 RepID=A0A9Q8PI21_PASFU|nr:uncharacterized protein CLAFUR5_12487 [Fulvia fulva]KAK4616305.1 hypothetical protein CLAFUR4_09756 [Fulvia fulva]KAK4616945.1 hypothetical protein CLAFUR0_09748 [Fulvia fulva]UJO22807.1 hypothetical protein CLAFUR5_12487 [Fulvia fulva]WPV19155.1 hypothetical protein CLAFUW4_09751 [Fulvia fulva]WPV34210.1 hypothetical protein CLAFUW7_09753 [Fulvia fulva]
MATQQQNHHTQQLDVATQKHWLLQTPKELVADFNTKKGENLAVLKISIYLFQGDHVLLFHQRDRPYPGEQEEWIVPHDIVRVDRPASHPTQQAVATIPIRIRTLHYLASMRVPIPLLHEIQFMEFSKPEPLSIHSGETLHIWAILTLYPHPLPPETREAFLTTLNNNAVYRWATEADVNQNRIKTPAFDTDITRSDQLHILDLKAAFKRLSLCCKFNITHVPPLASLSTTGHHILASVLEARAMRYAGDAGRYGMILLSNTSPRNLIWGGVYDCRGV